MLVDRQCMAVSTLLNTVWSFHSRMFWKVRAMPIRVILSGVGARTWVYSPACSPLYSFFILPWG